MKMKVMEVPVYPEIDIVGKTIDTTTGTIDRKSIGRCLITTEAVDKRYTVVGGDKTELKTVSPVDVVELYVELVGGTRSLASFKFFDAYVASNKENPEIIDIYTIDAEKISRLVECAERMSESHPECDGQWKIVDANDTRYFLRQIAVALTENGFVG